MNMNPEALKVIRGVIKGFSYALGVAIAKWAMTMIPLRGFNLNF